MHAFCSLSRLIHFHFLPVAQHAYCPIKDISSKSNPCAWIKYSLHRTCGATSWDAIISVLQNLFRLFFCFLGMIAMESLPSDIVAPVRPRQSGWYCMVEKSDQILRGLASPPPLYKAILLIFQHSKIQSLKFRMLKDEQNKLKNE